MIRLAALGCILLGLTLVALSLPVPGEDWIGSIELKTIFVIVTGISVAVYLLAVTLVVQGPATNAIWVVLFIAAALRLPLIIAPPFLSSDIYRYVWDGQVQAAGVNPYRYLPADPALSSLRDPAIYPHINRADSAPTIYAPAAQLIFAAVGQVWPSVTAIKLTMTAFEALTIACLLALLKAAQLPPERVLIYAWNPLPVWAFASSGHIDAVAIGLLALTLLLRIRQQNTLSGIALAASILTKFLPGVIAPVLWQPRQGWRTATAALATIIALYALYSSAGLKVFGFLAGYDAEEGYAGAGGGYWLLAALARLVTLPDSAARLYKALALTVLAGLAIWFAFIRRPTGPVSLCAAAGTMMAVLTFALSPHYPWYFAWLAMPAVLAPAPVLIWLGAAPMLMYLDTFGDRLVWPSVVYVPAILLAFLSIRWPFQGFRPALQQGKT